MADIQEESLKRELQSTLEGQFFLTISATTIDSRSGTLFSSLQDAGVGGLALRSEV